MDEFLLSFLGYHLTTQFGFFQVLPTAGSLPGLLIIIDKEARFPRKVDTSCGSKFVFAFGLVFIHLYINSLIVCQTQGQLKTRRVAKRHAMSSVRLIV